ncbi:MAG: SDR family NAD(P)-dependent oxidoreductase [Ignavibacteria bacterium]|nr:SDR family NAD(P)-dependent oxidoreductase [Ignavibacteria bacterium]
MKKAIVIGATSGIGRGLAELLAENGYIVGITGRRGELLNELAQSRPGVFIPCIFDVTDPLATRASLDLLAAQLGNVDLLILSSGTGHVNHTLNYSIEMEAVNTNVSGFTCIAGWAYTYFTGQKYGHLVVISSIAGLRGSRLAPAYNASKAYQINYLEGLRQRACKEKITLHITDVRPGLVDTAMAKGEGLFWVMPVPKIARQIYRAITKKKKIVYVSKRWAVLARFLKYIPAWLYEKI